MAGDRNTGGTPNGDSRPRQDSTTMPGQYPRDLPFGISVPTGTGAPGSAGQGGSATDPTMAGSATPATVFGAPAANLNTGSPGSAGATPHQESGASYTDPFAHLAGGGAGQMTGGSTDTEAQADKAGHPGPFGTAYPVTTGTGTGTPLIGGRGGKNRGR